MAASSAPLETDVAPLPLPTPGPELAVPGSTPSAAGASARPPPDEPPRGDLLVAPVVRLHRGHMGEPVGERSTGFLQFVDGVEAYTLRNLVARLFVNKPEISGRLIRMGSLYSSVQRGGDTPKATAANVRPPPGDTRTRPERERDSAAYVHMVALANYSRGLGLSLINTQAVVVQALHLAEKANHALVGTVTSVVRNHWLQNTVSAINKGSKTTINNYSGAVAAFCRWAAEKYGDDVPVMPISRTMVVTFLEAEKGRPVATRKRARPTEDEDDQPSSDEETFVHPSPASARPGGGRSAGPSSRQHVVDNATDAPTTTLPAHYPHENERAEGEAHHTPHGVAGSVSEGTPPTDPRVSSAEAHEAGGAPSRQVGPQVLLNNVNALSKIANTLNFLFRDATCECCSRWWREEYASAGSYGPAVSVVKQRKREKVLEDQAAGASKALGRRDPSMSDEQREDAVRRLLLFPTSATQHRLRALLAALFVLPFSLEARGTTARGIVCSDMVVR